MRMLRDSPAATAADASSAPLLITPASAAATALQPAAGGGSDASFDGDMVVILAAMLCVLACAIGLNSLIDYLRLQCGGRRTLITVAAPHAAAVAMASSSATDAGGLKKRELRRIPVVVYQARVEAAGVSASECAICLGEFDDGDKVRVLPGVPPWIPVECIDMWLATKPSCPTCRNSLLEPATAAGEEGA